MDGLVRFINNVEGWFTPWLPGQDVLALLAFALYVFLILGGGLAAVLSTNLVRALVGLVVTLLGVAGLYLLMASPFMAFMQLLIYVGAVCILIFFAIMLTRNAPGGEETGGPPVKRILYALLAAAAPLALFGPVLYRHAGRLMDVDTPVETPLADLGRGLLEDYVAPFEIISIVLLVAMAGGVLLVWEKRSAK